MMLQLVNLVLNFAILGLLVHIIHMNREIRKIDREIKVLLEDVLANLAVTRLPF